jgi:hypothetical protein
MSTTDFKHFKCFTRTLVSKHCQHIVNVILVIAAFTISLYYYYYCFQQLCLLTTTICITNHNYKLLFLKFQLFYFLFVACTSIYFIIIQFNQHIQFMSLSKEQQQQPQSHNIQCSKTFIHHFNTTQI